MQGMKVRGLCAGDEGQRLRLFLSCHWEVSRDGGHMLLRHHPNL